MKFTNKTYKWLIRRSKFRVKVFYWLGMKGHADAKEMIQRMKREELLMARLQVHIRRERETQR